MVTDDRQQEPIGAPFVCGDDDDKLVILTEVQLHEEGAEPIRQLRPNTASDPCRLHDVFELFVRVLVRLPVFWCWVSLANFVLSVNRPEHRLRDRRGRCRVFRFLERYREGPGLSETIEPVFEHVFRGPYPVHI